MKIIPLFLMLFIAGCQQFPQLPAGVVGVNLTYTIAPVVVAAPKDIPKPEPLLEPTAAPAPASVVMLAP